MNLLVDARQLSWQDICAAILQIDAISRRRGLYVFLACPPACQAEAERLCRHLALEDYVALLGPGEQWPQDAVPVSGQLNAADFLDAA